MITRIPKVPSVIVPRYQVVLNSSMRFRTLVESRCRKTFCWMAIDRCSVLEPVPPLSPGLDGATSWGSPDIGHRFRLIQILEGGTRGAAFVLKDGENFVGRELGEISFPTDAFVSGRHAVLQVHQDRLWVRDIGSSNGTFLRLSGPTELGDGDHLLIGRELLRIEVSGH